MLVRYEALVDDPENTTAALCKFLHIELEKNMIDPAGNKEYPDQFNEYYKRSWMNNSTKSIDLKRKSAWETEMSEGQVQLVELIARKELQ